MLVREYSEWERGVDDLSKPLHMYFTVETISERRKNQSRAFDKKLSVLSGRSVCFALITEGLELMMC